MNSAKVPELYDVVLVGGGLQSALIALAVLARHPRAAIALVERDERLGGNHTWCLHPADVTPEARTFVEPLIVHRFDGYDVRFPGSSRTLGGPYAAVTSDRLDSVVRDAIARSPASRCVLGRTALQLDAGAVTLDDGSVLCARLVVDARGPRPEDAQGSAGYQKFLGLELELDRPHGLARPLLMDARVEQREGLRFFYVLPFGDRRLLVEDTTFARDPRLDVARARADVLRYAEGFAPVQRVVREERGVLPLPWRGVAGLCARVERAVAGVEPLVAGYRGGFFHPATGYSFPCALRVACRIAAADRPGTLDAQFARECARHAAQARYAEQLNWLLFHGFAPEDMWNVFARFYRLPEPLIHRFYAMTLTTIDRARILAGAPPRGISFRGLFGAGRAASRAAGGVR